MAGAEPARGYRAPAPDPARFIDWPDAFGTRFTLFASGSISFTRATPFSTALRVPPFSWMVNASSLSLRLSFWEASRTLTWFASQPRPTNCEEKKFGCRA